TDETDQQHRRDKAEYDDCRCARTPGGKFRVPIEPDCDDERKTIDPAVNKYSRNAIDATSPGKSAMRVFFAGDIRVRRPWNRGADALGAIRTVGGKTRANEVVEPAQR